MNSTLSYLNSAVLSTLSNCLSEGNYQLIESLGVSPKAIEKLKNLSLSNTQLLSKAPGHVLSVSVDDIALNNYLDYLGKRKQQQELIDALLLADAPSAYMKEQFGIRREEYVHMRALLGLQEPKRGRSSLPEQREVIAEALYRLRDQSDDGILSPQNYLALHCQYQLSLRQIIALDQTIASENSKEE